MGARGDGVETGQMKATNEKDKTDVQLVINNNYLFFARQKKNAKFKFIVLLMSDSPLLFQSVGDRRRAGSLFGALLWSEWTAVMSVGILDDALDRSFVLLTNFSLRDRAVRCICRRGREEEREKFIIMQQCHSN